MAASLIDMNEVKTYWRGLASRRAEEEANTTKLIEQLIHELDQVTQAYEQESLDRQRDLDFTRRIQRENITLQKALAEVEKKTDRDSSVLVLIDGDGLLFEDKYVQEGEKGGIRAAGELLDHITQYVRSKEAIPSDAKVAVRIFANLVGLAKTYEQADIADADTVFEFARGFTMARALFDFVDCGSGKERADSKIRASFNLNLSTIQCRHIILGCSHDNGYARMLEELQHDDYEKITLLEGVPFTKELAVVRHRFGNTQARDLFRDTKIETNYSSFHRRPQVNGNGHDTSPVLHATALRTPAKTPLNGLYSSPYDIQRPESTSTSESGQTPATSLASPPPSNNWAGKVQAAAALPLPTAKSPAESKVSETAIRRNRKGNRLDPAKPKDLDMQLLQKVQSMKLCNNFFLKGYCHNANSTCEHDHYYKPSPKELAVLKYIARRIPCVRGTSCEDPKCTAGHRCAFVEGGECRFQLQGTCKFSKEMHHSDLTEVKATVVR